MAEQRLPIINSDDGQWGEVLNQFIKLEHFDDGTNNPTNGGHKTITIRPGTLNPGTAPLKFSSGPLMTSPEAGAVEFQNDNLYYTRTTANRRMTIAAYDDASGAGGDLYYRDADGNFIRLAVGVAGQMLTTNGTVPAWSTVLSGTSKITANTTAPTSPAVGDIWIDTN